jgi:hypothetical protein
MSAAVDPQVVDSEEFIPICDYHFLGDSDTVEKKREFISELRRESTVYHAALHVGVSRKTVYRWQEVDPDFAEAWADALQDATDVMEHSVYHQALNGDTLLKMFWLKKHRPEYRDKTTIDITVVQGEIQQRMQQLGMQQLPSAGTEFAPVAQQDATLNSRCHFPPQREDQQKEE